MKQILCFGDSNTWGLIPKTNQRYPWGVRWTSILDNELNRHFNNEYRVIEEGLCGRTTVFDDPLRDGRNSFKLLPTILESHNPVTDVIIMLGTNDCKTVYMTDMQTIENAWVDTKTGFLYSRDNYSYSPVMMWSQSAAMYLLSLSFAVPSQSAFSLRASASGKRSTVRPDSTRSFSSLI